MCGTPQDAALGAMVGAAVAAKKDRKAAADEQLHFRFRALALLEVFAKGNQDSPMLPVRSAERAIARGRRGAELLPACLPEMCLAGLYVTGLGLTAAALQCCC